MTTTPEIEKIWLEFGERLLHYIRRSVSSEDDAHDVLQIVFARIAKHVDRLDEVESVSGWVFRITRNAIADHYRSEATAARVLDGARQQEVVEADAARHQEPIPGLDTPRGEALSKCVRPLVNQLPSPYNEAIELTDLGGLSQKDAAEKLGISVSGMKSRVQRGRSKLKDVLLRCCTVELDGRDGVIDFVQKSDCGCKSCE